MIQVVVLFLLFVAALTVLARAGVVWMGRKAGSITRQRFDEARCIIDTARAPEAWLAQTAGLADHARDAGLLKRLDRVIEFFRTSPVVADRATRELLLDRLRDIRRQWLQTPPSAPPASTP